MSQSHSLQTFLAVWSRPPSGQRTHGGGSSVCLFTSSGPPTILWQQWGGSAHSRPATCSHPEALGHQLNLASGGGSVVASCWLLGARTSEVENQEAQWRAIGVSSGLRGSKALEVLQRPILQPTPMPTSDWKEAAPQTVLVLQRQPLSGEKRHHGGKGGCLFTSSRFWSDLVIFSKGGDNFVILVRI